MRVAVLGLWHLGSVTAACTAAAGHDVVGWDPDQTVRARLAAGTPPVAEPGLADLLVDGFACGRLRIADDAAAAVREADVVWITFDTPVDDDDRANVDQVVSNVEAIMPALKDGALVLVSSQLPVGTVARLERSWAASAGQRRISFACSPENLRLGKALDVFRNPDRTVIGARTSADRETLGRLFAPITTRLEFMSVESAEMTKHAINAFLATSVTFINEIAALCERTGADAREVERGLKSEKRIGAYAYLGPGAAFAGGTLARDVMFLRDLGREVDRPTPLMDGVEASNRAHGGWAQRRLQSLLGSLHGKVVSVWGLTYKPGTDTLRRSSAVELCVWLLSQHAQVRVHDPAVAELPPALNGVVWTSSPLDAASGADALVVATEWPEYRAVAAAELAAVLRRRLIIDANGFLRNLIGSDTRFRHFAVGTPESSIDGSGVSTA